MDSSVVGQPPEASGGHDAQPGHFGVAHVGSSTFPVFAQISDGAKGAKFRDVTFPGQLFQMDTVTRDNPGRASPVSPLLAMSAHGRSRGVECFSLRPKGGAEFPSLRVDTVSPSQHRIGWKSRHVTCEGRSQRTLQPWPLSWITSLDAWGLSCSKPLGRARPQMGSRTPAPGDAEGGRVPG